MQILPFILCTHTHSHTHTLTRSLLHSNPLSSPIPALPLSSRQQCSHQLTSSSMNHAWTVALGSTTPPPSQSSLEKIQMNKMATSLCLLSVQAIDQRNAHLQDDFSSQRERGHLIAALQKKIAPSISLIVGCPGHSHRWRMPLLLEAWIVTLLQESGYTHCWKAIPVHVTDVQNLQNQSIG